MLASVYKLLRMIIEPGKHDVTKIDLRLDNFIPKPHHDMTRARWTKREQELYVPLAYTPE